MNIGKFASAIRQARDVFVWVRYHSEDGIELRVSKAEAKLMLDEARETDVTEVDAHFDDEGCLHIG
jgi:hypothetical protein